MKKHFKENVFFDACRNFPTFYLIEFQYFCVSQKPEILKMKAIKSQELPV